MEGSKSPLTPSLSVMSRTSCSRLLDPGAVVTRLQLEVSRRGKL